MSQIQDPTVLVTGAARRLGAAMAKSLHNQGYCVIIHFNNSEKPAVKLAESLNALRPDSARTIKADLNNLDDIKSLAAAAPLMFGKLDVLINNASSFYPTNFGDVDSATWDDLFSSNLKAPFFLSQYLAPALKAQKGSILNISDIFAERPRKNFSPYCIAKAGNDMLTKSLALELAPDVRVNGIAPGAILWPEDAEGNEITNIEALDCIPLKKLGGASSIVETMHFLCNSANYVTGQIIPVDGGRNLNH